LLVDPPASSFFSNPKQQVGKKEDYETNEGWQQMQKIEIAH